MGYAKLIQMEIRACERPWSLHTRCGPIAFSVLTVADHAAARESCSVQSRHLAAALLNEGIILTNALGISSDDVQSIIAESSVFPLEAYRPPYPEIADLYRLSNECKRIFAYSLVEAFKRSTRALISAQDILVGLLAEDAPTSCVLRKHGLQIDPVHRALGHPLL